jgi:hypothetical protein
VSWTNDARCVRFTYRAHNRRTVAEIREKVIKEAGRNLFSRLVHAKSDKETFAFWRSDLNRILHIFNVCSVISVRPSLTARLQIGLGVDKNSQDLVSNIHRNTVQNQGGANDQARSATSNTIWSTFSHSRIASLLESCLHRRRRPVSDATS